MPRILFELSHLESPFVWRSKFALASKGLEYQPQKLNFTNISKVFDGRSQTVPVLKEEDGTEVPDTWAISEYLDQAYPDTPPLLDGANEARAREIDEIVSSAVFPAFFPIYVHDIWACLPEDQGNYFRESREARFGMTLEEMSANREARLPDARDAIQPLRDAFGGRPWLHGDTPAYGDYIALAFFVWIKSVAKVPPLAAGDPLLDWIDRGFSIYDGVATAVEGGPLAT
ncbi:MAG: glutathione S-transferase N-terminal domain-containing protein [Pseudomonadota bacterium]